MGMGPNMRFMMTHRSCFLVHTNFLTILERDERLGVRWPPTSGVCSPERGLHECRSSAVVRKEEEGLESDGHSASPVMKLISNSLLLVLVVLGLVSCGGVKKVSRATADLVKGGKKPVPEAAWNSERTWKRIADQPPTYVPYLFKGSPNESGEWIEDERDGKRLFIPAGGVDGFSEAVLRAEARKATRK